MAYMSNLNTKQLLYSQKFPVFWNRVACDLRLMSYEFKHLLQSLQYGTMGILTQITQKLPAECGYSAHRTTALLLNMSIFWIIVRCDIRMASYGLKHVWQSLSDMSFIPEYP